MSVNWDHFPRHESYASDRLPISMVAGRVHVTTGHPGFDWVPGHEAGLFVEPSVAGVVERVKTLAAAPEDEILELGLAAHHWARERMSHRAAARFMLAAVDRQLLDGLHEDPWHRLAREWPR